MTFRRRAASRLLGFVVRHSPDESRSWGDAMLREMDFVDDDWAALRWAVAVVVWTISVALLSSLMRASWLPPDEVKMAERVFVIAIPEALYLLGAVALWRRQRRVASGMLAAGVILITHGVVHFVTSG